MELQFAKQLNLNDSQRTQLKPFIEEFDRKLHEARRQQITTVHDAMDEIDKELSKILDPEQTKRFIELKRQFENFGPMGEGHPPGHRPPGDDFGPPPPPPMMGDGD